jgi:pyruvate dehydrogenase E2 component (dihydrolipoamide acetyltransferase)
MTSEQAPRGAVTLEDPSRIQAVVGRRMLEARATVPDFVLNTEIDAGAIVALHRDLKSASEGRAPTLNDIVIKACGLVLREFPRVNAAYVDGRFELYERVNVGVVVAAGDAVLAPTVYDADAKPLATIAAETRDLSARARDARLTLDEMDGGTFTVSNLGMFGVTSFAPIINPPQAAILGVGAIVERQGAHAMGLTFVGDHRIVNGADGGRFLARLRQTLEDDVAALA